LVFQYPVPNAYHEVNLWIGFYFNCELVINSNTFAYLESTKKCFAHRMRVFKNLKNQWLKVQC